jgi:hypothetical protein
VGSARRPPGRSSAARFGLSLWGSAEPLVEPHGSRDLEDDGAQDPGEDPGQEREDRRAEEVRDEGKDAGEQVPQRLRGQAQLEPVEHGDDHEEHDQVEDHPAGGARHVRLRGVAPVHEAPEAPTDTGAAQDARDQLGEEPGDDPADDQDDDRADGVTRHGIANSVPDIFQGVHGRFPLCPASSGRAGSGDVVRASLPRR